MNSQIILRLAANSRHLVWAVVGLVLFLGALWILHREMAGVHFADVLARFRALPRSAVLLALGFTFASYAALTGYDWLALRYIGRRLPYSNVALTSFIATAVGHNLGLRCFRAARCVIACKAPRASQPQRWQPSSA